MSGWRDATDGLQMLDTEKDSPAELVYPRLGYVRVSEQKRFRVVNMLIR